MTNVITEIKTRPLFWIFIVYFMISFLFCSLSLNATNRYKKTVKMKSISGEAYREPWNSEQDFVVRNGKEKILVKGTYLDDDTVGEILANGSVLLKDVSLTSESIAGNFHEFDYCKYLKSHNVDRYCYVQENNIAACDTGIRHGLSYLSWKIREKVEISLSRYFDRDIASWITAIMTGDTGKMDAGARNYLAKSGFSHLVAVSGAHIGFVSRPFVMLFKKLKVKFGKKKLICVLPAFALWFLAGFSPSVTRAFVSFALVNLAAIFRVRCDPANALGFSGIIQLLISPFSVFSSGFILSYACTVCIIMILPILRKIIRKKNKFADGLLTCLAINLGIVPITLLLFNSISPCGLLLNVFASDIAAILCIGGFIVFILDKLFFDNGILLIAARALTGAAYGFDKMCEKIGNGKSWFFHVETPSPKVAVIIIYYMLLLTFLLCLNGKKCRIPIIMTVAVIISTFFIICSRKAEVLIFDVGQGSAAYVKTSDGIAGLIDTGTGDVDLGELLRKEGVKNLDFVIISHGHDDHYGGFEKILETYTPDKVLVPCNERDEYVNSLDEKYNLNVTYIDKNATFSLGKNATLSLYESAYPADNPNNGSLVAAFNFGCGSILFPGDAESETLDELMARDISMQSDVLVLPHHGSITSGNENFLYAVSPKYAIISVGHNNSYGHPSQIVIDRLLSLGLSDDEIFRTDSDGAVRLIFRKGGTSLWQKKAKTA